MSAFNPSGFLERTIKFEEVAILRPVIARLQVYQSELDALVTNAPTTGAEIVSAVEAAAKQIFGSFVSAEFDAVLNVAEPPLVSLIEQYGPTIESYTGKVVAALQTIEAKLLAEANAA